MDQTFGDDATMEQSVNDVAASTSEPCGTTTHALRRGRSRILRSRGAAAGLALLVLGAPGAAWAGDGGGEAGGEGGNGSYAVTARVTFSGDFDPGKTGSVARVPATCWWQPADHVSGDPEEFKKYVEEYRASWGGSSITGGYAAYAFPSAEALEAAVERKEAGEDVVWYTLGHRAPAPSETMNSQEAAVALLVENGCTTVQSAGTYNVPLSYRLVTAGNPPEPSISAEDLAREARRVLHLREPSVEWNPRIGAAGQAALVHLPTWVWVEEEKAVNDLSVSATAGAITSTVEAKPSGMQVIWSHGSESCTPEQARRKFSPGREESSACTLVFDRSSHGRSDGFAVRTVVDWTASWSSNTGQGDDLEGQSMTATTPIRVAQSQALVTEVN